MTKMTEQGKIEIKVIRIGETGDPYEYFDEPVVPFTKEQEAAIEESAKKAFKEMSDFCGFGEK